MRSSSVFIPVFFTEELNNEGKRGQEQAGGLSYYVAEFQLYCDKYTTTVTSCAVTAYVPHDPSYMFLFYSLKGVWGRIYIYINIYILRIEDF